MSYRTPKFLVGILLLLMLAGFLAYKTYASFSGKRKPNVILITLETLRADHVGAYGYARNITPNLDAFAREAFFFKQAYSQAPCTLPSIPNILCSRYKGGRFISDDCVPMAEFFKRQGYHTVAIVAHSLLSKNGGFHRGFDFFDSDAERRPRSQQNRRATEIVNAAITHLMSSNDQPSFLWLHFYDPHEPYQAPAGFEKFYNRSDHFRVSLNKFDVGRKALQLMPEQINYLINAYDEEIRYLDHELGRFFRWLKQHGLYDHSMIVVTADHGEELGDNDHRWFHCQILSEEEIRVPLLIKLPGQIKGAVVESLVQTIDIYPTLTETVDPLYFSQHRGNFQGQSFGQFFTAPNGESRPWVMAFGSKEGAIIGEQHKYLRNPSGQKVMDRHARKTVEDSRLLNYFQGVWEKEGVKYYGQEEVYRHLRSLGYL